MILKSSLQLDWINSKTKEFKADPLIVEKVIRALVLLEELQKAGLNFIFKGGTSLMLMIQEPRRFSIDIDILIEDKTQNIETFLDRVIKNSDFTEWKEHKRKSYRATSQVNQLNKAGGDYTSEILETIPAGKGARAKALKAEVKHATKNKKTLNPEIHKLPKVQ